MASEPAEAAPQGQFEGDVQSGASVVLLVEDDLFIRMDVGEQLREAGWTVYEVGTADEAIELLRTPMMIDLVLTDVEMPGKLDGLGLAAYVRSERPALKLAIMSGHVRPAQQHAHLFDRFFSKPVTALVAELRTLMNATETPADRSPRHGTQISTKPNDSRS
ncbi:MAG: response regulator [Mesorhizobium sp.]|nr:MAG: response regulator [Mesorhizobium sp.]